MREIKFKGKSLLDGTWVYGGMQITQNIDAVGIAHNYYSIGTIINTEYTTNNKIVPVREETISQFTGLYDKNGKEIYENDIVEWAGYTMKILWGEDCGVGYGFIWEPCGSNIDYVESMTGFIDEYEVIGNIFDNPELLEGNDEN